MNGVPQKPTYIAWARPRILLSFLSVLAGWAAFLVCCFIQVLIRPVYGWDSPLVVTYLMGMGSGIVLLAVWLIVLVPFALFVPSRSVLWKPGILALLGAFAGPIIVALELLYGMISNPTITIYQPYMYLLGVAFFPGLPSVLIGGVTGAVAARLHQRLLRKESAQPNETSR